MSVHLIPTLAEHAAMYGSALHPANRLTACGRAMGELDVTVSPERATCRTCLRAASTTLAPKVHDCGNVTGSNEVGILDCGHGCKRVRCGCSVEFDSHRSVYGCTGMVDGWRKRVSA